MLGAGLLPAHLSLKVRFARPLATSVINVAANKPDMSKGPATEYRQIAGRFPRWTKAIRGTRTIKQRPNRNPSQFQSISKLELRTYPKILNSVKLVWEVTCT